jgi:lipid II:glycine glycyltransferase (peptidoglycan interpeptide bridge formation enzyme)
MKRLGVPPHTIDYYINSYREFGSKMIIFWVKKEGTVVAGLLGFACGSRISIVNTVSDPRYWQLRPNDLVHWEFVKWAKENGYLYFDFGNVRYDGQMTYKKKWGCILEEHGNYFICSDENTEPAQAVNSSSAAMKRAAALWSRYVPISVAKAVGPTIRKQLAK